MKAPHRGIEDGDVARLDTTWGPINMIIGRAVSECVLVPNGLQLVEHSKRTREHTKVGTTAGSRTYSAMR